MSNAAKPNGQANARGGATRPPPMTTAARELLARQQRGLAGPPPPFKMPEVEQGEMVMYQGGSFNRSRPSLPAVVMQINPNSLELMVFDPQIGPRLLPDSVRHKDDPELARLRRVNSNDDERHEIGVWFHAAGHMTAVERRRARLLLEIYKDELDEFDRTGTISGRDVKPTATTAA